MRWRWLFWTLLLTSLDVALRRSIMLSWSLAEKRCYTLSVLCSGLFWWAAFRLLARLSRPHSSYRLIFFGSAFLLAILSWLPFGVYFHYGTFPIQDIVVFLANAPGMVADVMPHVISVQDSLWLAGAACAISLGAWAPKDAERPWPLPTFALSAVVLLTSFAPVPASFPLTPLANSLRVASQLARWRGAPPSFFTLAQRYPADPPAQPHADNPDAYDYLWIVGESMGARYLTAYGYPEENAPALDGVLTDPNTVRLEHLNASSTCTDVSIPSLMSGMEATRPLPEFLSAELPYDLLKARGYGTFFISSHKLSWAHLDKFLGDRFLDVLQGAETLHHQVPDNYGAPDTETYTAGLREMDRIDSAGGNFFGVLHVRTMHTPYQVDPALPAPVNVASAVPSARYASSMRYFDRMFGAFWQQLQTRRYGRKTIVFFLADHGESFGQHGGYTHCARYYDEETRVPGFIHFPPRAVDDPALQDKRRVLEQNRTSYVSNIDVLPTFLDLASVDLKPLHKQLDGQSLAAPLNPERRYLISNCADFRRCPIRGFAFYQEGIKYLYDANTRRWRAYDEASDPAEQNDVGDLHQREIAAALPVFQKSAALSLLLPRGPQERTGSLLGTARGAVTRTR